MNIKFTSGNKVSTVFTAIEVAKSIATGVHLWHHASLELDRQSRENDKVVIVPWDNSEK